ncbi:MAG: hypothetical protein ACEPO8_08685 [Rhodothermaceae bacterium]
MKKYSSLIIVMILLLTGCSKEEKVKQEIHIPMEIPVVVVKYFPADGENLDVKATGDVSGSLTEIKTKVNGITKDLAKTLEEASRFRAYKNQEAKPSLTYKVVKEYEFFEALPTYDKEGHSAPMTDYNEIVKRINGQDWVDNKGVKEIWVWGYHGGVVDLWESNMASPTGDVSNSDRDENDLPIYKSTYTLYHYNYGRSLSETIENHMHQIEAVLNHVDGRDDTDPEKWNELLFWGKYVGSDKSHKIINPGCGWAHYPPNGERDYDWKNQTYVMSDIEDWKPDGTGKKTKMNSDRWNSSSIDWFVFWMQSLPGHNNGLKHKGKELHNWWIFIGDYDNAVKNKYSLVK